MIKINKNFVIGALAAIIVIDEAVIIPLNNRRFLKRLEHKDEMINYLATQMDKHKTPFDEFDKIAMRSM